MTTGLLCGFWEENSQASRLYVGLVPTCLSAFIIINPFTQTILVLYMYGIWRYINQLFCYNLLIRPNITKYITKKMWFRCRDICMHLDVQGVSQKNKNFLLQSFPIEYSQFFIGHLVYVFICFRLFWQMTLMTIEFTVKICHHNESRFWKKQIISIAQLHFKYIPAKNRTWYFLKSTSLTILVLLTIFIASASAKNCLHPGSSANICPLPGS